MAGLGRTLLVTAVIGVAAGNATAQERDQTTVIDSIAVRGLDRTGRAAVVTRINIALGQPVGFLDVQRAIEALFATGAYEDVKVFQGTIDGRQVLVFEVVERPILWRWDVEGTSKLPERSVRGKVRLQSGRAFNPADVTTAIAAIDSLYKKEGYYQTVVEAAVLPREDGRVEVALTVNEGSRVAVSRVIIEGNQAFEASEIVSHMSTRPEGFFWFKKGEYDEQELLRDVRERLPAFYASRGYIDFQVLRDTLVVNEGTGKGTLILAVDEGEQHSVGMFEIIGNREFTIEQLEGFYPFGEGQGGGGFLGFGGGGNDDSAFDLEQWALATEEVTNLYFDNGYIRAQVRDVMTPRTAADGSRVVDLRWQITEGPPAIVNRVRIVGNTITHEDVIRRAIYMVPGDVFRRSMFIQSYQSISNLGFFEQPLPSPRTEPANQQGDIDVIFEVKERRTGNINFGASVGQGTGVGGFIGLEEPNLFGKAKRINLQVQFGSNLSDFNITYTDPAIRGSLLSGSLRLHNTRQRFTIADLGRITTRGGSFQIGMPLFGSRFTRVLGSYLLEQSDFDSPTLLPVFSCTNCILSSASVSVVRDTRVGLPFATGGTLHKFDLSQNGGLLGGSGNFRRATFEGRWYAPLSRAVFEPGLGGLQFLLGFTAKTGFVWGDAGPHFRQLFSMGGIRFGIPLRGYDEFSITPNGFDPTASGSRASGVNAFGGSYAAFTGEIGLRLSQALYVNTFVDAGNVWGSPGEFNPTRLMRGAGIGLNLVSPLGPIGLDYAYGFDRTDLVGNPNPGWQFHFKLGNFF